MASNSLDISPDRNGGVSPLKDFQLTTNVTGKKSAEFGKQICVDIWGKMNGVSSYFWARNARFRKNRLAAAGKLDMSVFMDRLDFNGKTNYVNLDWKALQICGTIISRMVGRWMKRNEKIDVSAVDPVSISAKKEKEDDALFYYENKDMLQELQQQSGVPVIPKDQFVAEDKDDLDNWRTEFNRIPEEISYDLAVNEVLRKNGWFDVMKKKLLHDSAECGLVGTYTWMDDEGQIHVEWIKAENAIYSYTNYDDFRDTSWRGHIGSMKLGEIRAKYPEMCAGQAGAELLWNIAGSSKDWQYYDKIRFMLEWNVSIMMPYDDWNVDVMFLELKSFDSDGYTVTKTKKNNSTIIRKGKPEKLDDNQEYVEEKKWNIYKGVYIPVTNTLLEWGLKKNMIRPQDPKELGNAEFSYSYYMYENYIMRNVAVPEKIEQPLEQMILALLKMQQLVAKMKPAGAAINVDAMQELDLGLANMSKPMDVQRIWEQTGNLYYRGRDAEGNAIPVPITELANAGFIGQMQALIELYNFNYKVLTDQLGEDPNLPQLAAQPRVAAGNVDTSISITDDTTDHYYDAYKHCMEETAKKVACLLNKSVSYGAKKYRELLKQDDVKGRDFQTAFRMLPNDAQLAMFQNMLNTAMANNERLILYIDPFKLIKMCRENAELAFLYFKNGQKRYLRTEQQIAQQNSEQNAQIQQSSMEAKAKGDSELKDKELNGKERLALVTGAFDLLKTGNTLPPELQPVLMGIIQNVSLPLMVENEQIRQGIQQAQMQQQEQMEQQQQAVPMNEPQQLQQTA